jgi:hypothetical protein
MVRSKQVTGGCRTVISWVIALSAGVVSPGCWWQREAYTDRMMNEMKVFELRAQYDQYLGDPFQPPGDFPVWIRPPKVTTLRALPKELEGVLLGLFQGNEAGGNLIEFVIIGSVGDETLTDFVQKSMEAMNKAGKGPGAELSKRDPATVPCMHGGETSFDVYSGGATRQLPGAAPANYQWVYYFTEEGRQKILLAFVIPDENYTAMTNPMVKSLESLALSSKIGAATSGVAAAPAAGAPAGGSGAENF